MKEKMLPYVPPPHSPPPSTLHFWQAGAVGGEGQTHSEIFWPQSIIHRLLFLRSLSFSLVVFWCSFLLDFCISIVGFFDFWLPWGSYLLIYNYTYFKQVVF